MKKPLLILLVLLASASLLGGGAALIATREVPSPEEPTIDVPLVRHMTVQRTPLTLSVSANGTVRPRASTTLVAEVAGRILDIAPDLAEGAFCSADDVLLRIDTEDLGHQRTRAEHLLAQAELRLAVETREAGIAAKEWEANGEGDPDPMTVRTPQLAEAEAAVAAAGAEIKQIELMIRRSEIRAPWDARIRIKHVDLGQFVAPGTPLLELYAIDAAEVELPVPDRDLAFLDLPLNDGKGQGPDVSISALIGGTRTEWKGSIVRTGAEIDARTRLVPLVARVQDPFRRKGKAEGPPLMPGLFVDAEISGIRITDLIVVPRYALQTGDILILVDGENALRFRKVDVLRRESDRVLIRGGLEEGERICLSPLEAPVDGMKVRLESTGDKASK